MNTSYILEKLFNNLCEYIFLSISYVGVLNNGKESQSNNLIVGCFGPGRAGNTHVFNTINSRDCWV